MIIDIPLLRMELTGDLGMINFLIDQHSFDEIFELHGSVIGKTSGSERLVDEF